MKIFIPVIILLVTNLHFVIAEPACIGNGEIIFYNRYAEGVRVKVIPVGSIFSGPDATNGLDHKYWLKPSRRWPPDHGTNWVHVVGGSRAMPLLPPYWPPDCESGGYTIYDWDDGANYHQIYPQFVAGAVSYGLWKVEFWKFPTEDSPYLINSCWLDYRDWRAPQGCSLKNDLFIMLTTDNIYFNWSNSFDQEPPEPHIPITNQYVPNRTIKWNPQLKDLNGGVNQCPGGVDKGNFLTTSTDGGYWLNWPINAHALNSNYEHITPGLLYMNLSIVSGMTVNILQDQNMYVEYGATLSIQQYSTLNFQTNSKLYIKDGGGLCNYGGTINNAHIIFARSSHTAPPCYAWTGILNNSKLIIEDSAIVWLADSTVLTFDSTSQLIMKPHSEFRLGTNAKIIFQNSSNLFCDSAKFTSIDSNTTWDGIYLNDLSYDTLKYCTFENALNGVNISDNISLYDVPAVEISNCTFSNKTGSQLLNQVYVNNSANVMIRNCTSSSLISEGFAAGIIMEYCSAGGMNVIDNNINYVSSGINVIQSSPYIARNTITGPEASGTGIYLDNSNGTIEYNTVNNFENSALFYYSSPYVLKNHFSNASLSAVDITAVSVPVMKPIISGTELSWLGGNNYFTGSPENAGITFNSDSYPLMDSGYNIISVGNSLYMHGTITTELKARINNWYDDPPDDEKFDISAGVDYSEYFDGQTIPGTDYYDLNSIGFGLYDTVFVDDLEQNTISPEEMFILAYRKEMERHFTDAIDAYKNVTSTYKTSNYAVSSLARIFNCLEKMIAGINEYNSIKTYYTGLKNSNNYPIQVREISEDLAIKSKVRMGQIEDAISDYQTIINNFPNTPKSVHAQINKMCLENMLGEGDMMMNGQGSSTNYKSRLLTLITGKEPGINKPISGNLPKHFRLYQNYPNPFNPMTSIKYEIPQDANIKLTVYDITGREIISINEYRQAGVYTYTFDGTNLASGVYIYKIDASTSLSTKYVETKKMVLIK